MREEFIDMDDTEGSPICLRHRAKEHAPWANYFYMLHGAVYASDYEIEEFKKQGLEI